jgi:hypothetical protein
MRAQKLRTGPERQKRWFKARAIKFNRKLDRLGQRALEPRTFSNLMIEGNALLTFMSVDLIANGERTGA